MSNALVECRRLHDEVLWGINYLESVVMNKISIEVRSRMPIVDLCSHLELVSSKASNAESQGVQ